MADRLEQLMEEIQGRAEAARNAPYAQPSRYDLSILWGNLNGALNIMREVMASMEWESVTGDGAPGQMGCYAPPEGGEGGAGTAALPRSTLRPEDAP